jgi:hypothetical protein
VRAAPLLILLAACAHGPAPAGPASGVPDEPEDAATATAPAGDDDDDAGCAWDAPDDPAACDRVPRRGRVNRLYVNEAPQLELLLRETPQDSPDHERILVRLASTYLELACLAYRECITAQLNGKAPSSGVRATARDSYAKHRARCAELDRERSDAGTRGLCP